MPKERAGCSGVVLIATHEAHRVFREKERGSINAEYNRNLTVPIIHGYLGFRGGRESQFTLMQDGASGHAARETYEELRSRGLSLFLLAQNQACPAVFSTINMLGSTYIPASFCYILAAA